MPRNATTTAAAIDPEQILSELERIAKGSGSAEQHAVDNFVRALETLTANGVGYNEEQASITLDTLRDAANVPIWTTTTLTAHVNLLTSLDSLHVLTEDQTERFAAVAPKLRTMLRKRTETRKRGSKWTLRVGETVTQFTPNPQSVRTRLAAAAEAHGMAMPKAKSAESRELTEKIDKALTNNAELTFAFPDGVIFSLRP